MPSGGSGGGAVRGEGGARLEHRIGRFSLLVLVAMAVAGCGGGAWFVDTAGDRGLDFVYRAGTGERMLMPEIAGGGAAMFDYDRDGDLDLYVANGNDTLPSTDPDPANIDHLFRQEADGRLVDVTAEAGLGDPYSSMGVSVADYDNDGYEDLYVTNFGPDRMYHNQGDGTFTDATRATGIADEGWSVGSVFFDYDRDGFLDLFVAKYIVFDPGKVCRNETGAPDWCGPSGFKDRPSILWHNQGDGTFVDVSQRAGILGAAYSALGVIADDFDADGWLDLYVTNDGDPNTLWRNQHDGTFVNMATTWGVALNFAGEPEASMGVVADDLDGDGLVDLFMTHLHNEKNTLYHNSGGSFRDDSVTSGLAAPSRPLTGFGAVATDIDFDGDLDLVVVNGRVNSGLPVLDGARPPAPWNALAEPNDVYINDGHGSFARLAPERCGLCGAVEVSRGLVSGDLDRDGDEDLLVVNVAGPLGVWENRAPKAGRWIDIGPWLPREHRAAIGANITVRAGQRSWRRTVHGSMSYACAREPRVLFGLGDVNAVDAIEIGWPDGTRERFGSSCVDCRVDLKQGEGTITP